MSVVMMVGCTMAASACDDYPEIAVPAGVDAFLAVAIPEAHELPGEGWAITAEADTLAQAPHNLPDACNAFNDAIAATGYDNDFRVGQTSRVFRRPDGLMLRVVVAVFRNDASAEDVLPALALTTLSQDYLVCISDVVRSSSLYAETDVASSSVQPWAVTPRDGGATAAEFLVDLSGGQTLVRIETYFWNIGNAAVTVAITGETAALSEELVTSLIATIAATMESAAAREGS